MLPPSAPQLNEKGAHILIIDDEPSSCLLLATILHGAGFASTAIAHNDTEVFAEISRHPPDLILLDIIMPRVNGLEVCQKLKKNAQTAQIPMVFLSALEGVEVKTKAFSAGGVDYITKPYHKKEVLARVATHVRNSLAMGQLAAYNHAVGQELLMAEAFQKSLLPSDESLQTYKTTYALNLAAAFLPCTQLAGDHWAFLPIDKQTFGIFLCDFSGHGIAAAFEVVRLHSLLYEFRPFWRTPKKLFKHINKRLSAQLSAASFATAHYAVFDTNARMVEVLGAGAPALLQLCPSQKTFMFHNCSGLPLGVDAHKADFSYTKTPYQPHDIFLFYSDALSEAPHKAFGVDFLAANPLQTLLNLKPFTADAALKHTLSAYLSAPSATRNDDLTLVAVQPLEKRNS